MKKADTQTNVEIQGNGLELYPPEFFSETGGRSNNEDAVFPLKPTSRERLFIVCDGVGGQHKGEIAASIVSSYFHEHLEENFSPSTPKKSFETALSSTESKLREYIHEHPESRDMATTLAVIYFSEEITSAHVGWVGDSRIYHIRNGEILYQTKDHSEVQHLLDMGELTPREAAVYPRKNIILRAVSGSAATRIDYKKIDGILPDDFFLLCTDGLLENLKEEHMTAWFTSTNDPAAIKDRMLKNAAGRTRDNYSAYILKTGDRSHPP